MWSRRFLPRVGPHQSSAPALGSERSGRGAARVIESSAVARAFPREEASFMTQTQAVKQLLRAQRRSLVRSLKQAYKEGFEAGLARAHGAGRRGRTIRGDATVDG